MKAFVAGVATPFVAVGCGLWLLSWWHDRFCPDANCRWRRKAA